MAQKFLVSLDLNKNELQNVRIQNLGTAPSSPVTGQIYFDTVLNTTLEWNGTAWITLDPSKGASGVIPLSKLTVDPLARANHTGTQAGSTITGLASAVTSGSTNALKSATTTIDVSVATAPTVGQVLTATSGTAATWQNPASGGVTSVTGTAPIVSSGGTTPVISINAATTSAPGSLSATDKTKLDSVASGATANSTDASLRDRSTHTNTQLASTISNFDTQVRTSTLAQMATPTGPVAMGSQKFTGLANGSSASDSAAFGQIQTAIDAALVGLKWKDPVRVASTANVAVATALVNASVIDGITLATGDRVLLKDQTAGAENGIYIVVASGAASRSLDANTSANIKDMSVLVAQGTLSEGFQFKLQTDNVTLGTTSLSFIQHGAGATVLTAGNGLTATANAFNVGAGTGITVAADSVAIDPTVVVRKYAATLGDGTSTSIAITHSLNNSDSIAVVRQVSDNVVVVCDIVYTSANVVTVSFAVAPATNALRIAVFG